MEQVVHDNSFGHFSHPGKTLLQIVHVWLNTDKNETFEHAQVELEVKVNPNELSHNVQTELEEHVKHPGIAVLHKTQLNAIEL
jgi:hypothetical protein